MARLRLDARRAPPASVRRLALGAALTTLGLGACAEPDPATTVRVHVERSPWTPSFCANLETRDAAGQVVATLGTATDVLPDRAAMKAAGAFCLDDLGATPELELPCATGPSSVTLTVVGIFGDDGLVDHDDYSSPCPPDGEPCVIEFACVARTATDVTFSPVFMKDPHEGFFDIDVRTPRLPDVCYALRVTSGDGSLILAQRDLCSSAYGDRHGSLSYVTTCDAAAPDNQLTLFMADVPSDAPDVPAGWVNPCPGTTESSDGAEWTGGCTRTVRCVEDADTVVSFDLGAAPPSR